MTLLSLYEENKKEEANYERIEPEINNSSNPFRLSNKTRDYQKQYFHVYSKRLEALRARITAKAKKELGSKADIKRLSQLDDIEVGKSVVVIGTLFKTQVLKPNILKEVGEENAVTNEEVGEKVILDKYVDESDELVLEDELQRARLHFSKENTSFTVAQFVSGIVCGILGSMIPSEAAEGGGKFKVENVILPDYADQTPLPKINENRHIALISGIELSGESSVQCLGALQLASSLLTGSAGAESEQENNSKIERLVVAGNSLSSETRDRNILSTAKYLTSGLAARSVDAVNALDEALEDFSSGMHVDIMPGANDPASQILPQQPLHLCLFPRASNFKTLKTVCNPYTFETCGVTILGSSGQNIEDVMKNSSLTDPLDAMEQIIRWSHLAPTCPDTLGCYPFHENDPFVLETLPHIFFVGNQEKFAQRKLKLDKNKDVLLIALPKFSVSSTIILLNLKNFECKPLVFSHLQ